MDGQAAAKQTTQEALGALNGVMKTLKKVTQQVGGAKRRLKRRRTKRRRKSRKSRKSRRTKRRRKSRKRTKRRRRR